MVVLVDGDGDVTEATTTWSRKPESIVAVAANDHTNVNDHVDGDVRSRGRLWVL